MNSWSAYCFKISIVSTFQNRQNFELMRLFHFILALILAALWETRLSHAALPTGSTNTAQIDFGGNIEPECKARTKVKARSTRLDLSSATMQKTNHVYIWCNTGQNSVQATYKSTNGGRLVNEQGDYIPYMIRIPETLQETNFISARTVTQRAGSGTEGNDLMRTVKIRPLVTGFENAGVYRDTIAVTVALN